MSRLLLISFDDADAKAGAGFARVLGMPFDHLFIGSAAPAHAAGEKVLHAQVSDVAPADSLAAALAEAAKSYSHIALVSSMRGKDVGARLAGHLGAAMVTDAIGVESETAFDRPIVAGSMVARVQVDHLPVVITYRPANFPAGADESAGTVESLILNAAGRTARTSVSSGGGSRPDLTQAKVIVSGGRPLKDAETFEKLIGGLADALGGAAGATRAAVDSGIAPNELQVGQTGKIVAPDLYIAAGISGSTQHMAGMKDSKLIVAINKDPDAPIFDVADIGLVGDLYDVIPQLLAKLGR